MEASGLCSLHPSTGEVHSNSQHSLNSGATGNTHIRLSVDSKKVVSGHDMSLEKINTLVMTLSHCTVILMSFLVLLSVVFV